MGTWVQVHKLPTCDVCRVTKARLDIRTSQGPWGNFCVKCAAAAIRDGVWTGKLGTGYGQVLTLNDDPAVEAEVMRAVRRGRWEPLHERGEGGRFVR
jgi:hypothetical protein